LWSGARWPVTVGNPLNFFGHRVIVEEHINDSLQHTIRTGLRVWDAVCTDFFF
jgi:hypothetical protein